MAMEQPQPPILPPIQKLPAGLAGVLNSPIECRDSAYYSTASKHSSAASCVGLNVVSSASGSGSQSSPADKTPSPCPPTLSLQPIISPSNSNMSVASIMSPNTPASSDAHQLIRPRSHDSVRNGTTTLQPGGDHDSLSRRESFDSRINQGLGDMKLGTSLYSNSHNPSTTSIHHQSVQQQRHPSHSALDGPPAHHNVMNTYQPATQRTPSIQVKVARTAPAITGPATSQIARAAEPTKGQAWAFPEEEIQKLPPGACQALVVDSRRSSVADSLTSSLFTVESRLPPGQYRLDEDFPRRPSTTTNGSDFASYPHHHAPPPARPSGDEAGGAPLNSLQPYSRTPEHRVSHKLAERKRRTEMKELFEQLRDLMPHERGSKASKWEILTKAITEHQRQTENIKYLQSHFTVVQSELDMLRREVHALRIENQQLRSDLSTVTRPRTAADPPRPSGPSLPDAFGGDQFDRRPELPPLRSLHAPGVTPTSLSPPDQSSAPDAMTGVQYEQPRINGFR